jgi:dolichol-phosphate mannosyltransferase
LHIHQQRKSPTPLVETKVMDLSFILPVINEADNLRVLIPQLDKFAARERIEHEIIVVDGCSTDGTPEVAAGLGAKIYQEIRPGYAGALATGFARARGDFIVTLDADLSHDPGFVGALWRERLNAQVVIASRYVEGGASRGAFGRDLLSRVLNRTLRIAVGIPVRDLSSGFRLYHRDVVAELPLESRNFEVLEEIIVKAWLRDFTIIEVPFTYMPRHAGSSHARILRFGMDLAAAALRLRRLARARS